MPFLFTHHQPYPLLQLKINQINGSAMYTQWKSIVHWMHGKFECQLSLSIMRTLLILLPGWVDDQGVKLSAKNYRVLSPIMNFTADADIGFLLKMIKA